jgi:DNA-binding PadR family transcriptional regulator
MSYSLGYNLSFHALVIIQILFEYRGLTANQIAHILHWGEYTLAQEKSVYNYLRKLKKQKLVTAYRLQGDYARGSIYYLTPQGFELAKHLLNIDRGKTGEGWVFRQSMPGENYGDFPYDLYKPPLDQTAHHLLLIEFFKQLRTLDEEVDYNYRINLYAAKEYEIDGQKHRYRPDAEVKFGDGRIFAVEIDRATESHEQLRRKFRTYRNYLQYLHRNNEKLPSGIFFVVEEKRRHHGMKRRWENVMSAFFEEIGDFHKDFYLVMTSMDRVPDTVLFEYYRDEYEKAANAAIRKELENVYDKVSMYGYFKQNPIKITFSPAIHEKSGLFDLYSNVVCHEMDTALYSRVYDFYQRIEPNAEKYDEVKGFSLNATYISCAFVQQPFIVHSLDSYEVDELLKKTVRSLQTRCRHIQLDRIE